METFGEWLEEQLRKRSWKAADLARAARVRDSTLSRILNGTRRPSPEVCRAIAQALDVSPILVFRQAKWLPAKAEPGLTEDELLHHYRQLDDMGQREALAIVKVLKEIRSSDDR